MKSKRFSLYYYEDGVKLTRYPLIALFVERSKENWQSKVFAITMLSCTFITASVFLLEFLGITSIYIDCIHIAAYSWYLVSYIIFVRKQNSDMALKLKELEELFNSESAKKKKVS